MESDHQTKRKFPTADEEDLTKRVRADLTKFKGAHSGTLFNLLKTGMYKLADRANQRQTGTATTQGKCNPCRD